MIQDDSTAGYPGEKRADPSDIASVQTKPKRKRRRLLKSLIAVVALIALLVILAPTILGTGLGRAIVVEELNDRLINGKLQIKDWSIGWFGPVRIEGLELIDANNVHLISVSEIDSPLSLLKAVRGNLDLGDLTITGADVNAVVDPQGKLNLLGAFKPSGNQPTKLPNIKGVVHLQNITGTLQDDPGGYALSIDPSHPLSGTVTIKEINQPIEDSISLGAQLNEREIAMINIEGTAGAISGNRPNADAISASQTVELRGIGARPTSRPDRIDIYMTSFPWDSLLAILKAPGGPVEIPGFGRAGFLADMDAANLLEQFPQFVHLKPGVNLQSGRLIQKADIAIDGGKAQISSRTSLLNLIGTENGHPIRMNNIAAAASATAVGGARLDLRDIKLSLVSAFAGIGGGGDSLGKLNINASADLANLQKQLGQIIDLDALLGVPAGSQAQMSGIAALNLTSREDGSFSSEFKASGVKIAVPGRRAVNEPKLTATITGNLHNRELNNLAIAVNSPAINIRATGRIGVSAKELTISQSAVDLRLAQEEFGGALSWFVAAPAFGEPETLPQMLADNSLRIAAGKAIISGAWQAEENRFGFAEPLEIRIEPTDVTVADEMGTVQPVHLPEMKVAVSGNGVVNARHRMIANNLTLDATIGVGAQTLLTSRISADVEASNGSALQFPRIQLDQCEADLSGLQATFGPLLPMIVPAPLVDAASPSLAQLLAHGIVQCTSGKLTASMAGSYDGTTFAISQPMAVSIANLILQQNGGDSTPIICGRVEADVRQFSCPTDQLSNQTIASLIAGGNLRIDSFQTKGIVIQNLDVPFDLSGGILRTAEPEGQTAPKPAVCNGGMLDIGVITLDLRRDPMLLTISGVDPGQPRQILKDVSLNPALAGTLFGELLNNPAFADAQSSRGLASVWIVQCRDVPLGDLLTQASPANTGVIEARYSIHEMQLGSALLTALGNPSVSGQIDNADVLIQGGKLTQDSTLMIDGNKPLRIAGVVILATKRFAPMTAYISRALLGNLIPPELKQVMPDQIVVPMTGDVSHPKLDLAGALKNPRGAGG